MASAANVDASLLTSAPRCVLSTEQIMEHVRIRATEICNEHIGDKFASDKLAEQAKLALNEVS